MKIARLTTPHVPPCRMFPNIETGVLAGGGTSLLPPDLSHAGDKIECPRVVAMAEARDVALAPHCPLGLVASAACLQPGLGVDIDEARVAELGLKAPDWRNAVRPRAVGSMAEW